MDSPGERLDSVRHRIDAACAAAGRPAGQIRLLAVSKKKPHTDVLALHSAGQGDFGENYLSEAIEKIRRLDGIAARWHFVGAIQSRAAKGIAENFDWVHTLARPKEAERLERGREGADAPLQVCIQVNTSGEESKSGVDPGDALALAREVANFPNLRLRGLMSMPRPSGDFCEQRAAFRELSELKREIVAEGVEMDTLSMGMSGDMEAAIREGATIVRVGTALFGPRE